ncbi:MAG: Eco57I restriction-modification methylase domain-containing protein [Verrucomicrobiia bacterium]
MAHSSSPAQQSLPAASAVSLSQTEKRQTGMSVLPTQTGMSALPYDLKRYCIEHSLYGVDIDPGAVEICKLRFWLSMIVDEEDFHHIKPLPNLDYKIVCGDSLLGVEKNVLNWQSFNQLEKLKSQYFNETNASKKQEYKKQIDGLIKEITKGHTQFDFEVYFSEVFHKDSKFDIVIGNPPYIQLQKDGGRLAKLYEKQNYKTFARTGDIYCLFYEKGIQLLKDNGILCYITSNKWMRAGYGEKLRSFFMQYNPTTLIDLGPGIFENATVDTNILLIQKTKTHNKQLKAVTLQKQNDTVNIEQQLQERAVILEKLTQDAWFIGSSAEQQLKEKIERIGKPLKDWNVNIYRGVLTGLNEAFIITKEKRNEILANCKDEDERRRTEAIIKPILRGRDIKRYYYEWAGLWVIGTFPALCLNIEDYPAIKKYFLDNFDIRQLEQSGKKYPELGFDARKKTGNKWFETQDQIAYYPEFEKEKIIYIEIMTDNWEEGYEFPCYTYKNDTCFVLNTAYIMTGKNLKYILGVLNSNFGSYLVKQHVTQLQKRQFRMLAQYVNNFEIPPITPANQPIVSQIEALVDKILAAKKENPQADTKNFEEEIDHLVYNLYDLIPDEIKIIEGGKKL